MEKAAGQPLKDVLKPWLEETGLSGLFGPEGKGACGPYSVLTFQNEPEDTLVVYGTIDEVNTNREAAVALQKAIRERHSNFTVPVRSDKEVTEDELKNHHVVLIGNPGTNAALSRLNPALPVHFGAHSFTVGSDTYAHADTGVAVAAANPRNPRFSVVLVAGMGPAATLRTAPKLSTWGARNGEVIVYPPGVEPLALVIPVKAGEERKPVARNKP
jgi:hypothetical protein